MDYTLHTLLGRGGMGEVWAAVHGPTGAEVAVKLLTSEASASDRARAGLLAEVRATARLDHPNVVVVLDQGVSEAGAPWLAMERAEGDLVTCPLTDWPSIQACLLDVLAGLAHVHARGLVHRDLKPENVLRVGGRWKIADLGIAHAMHGWLETTARAAGSPAYMAPEQLRGELERQGPATDLYAVGCLAWELVHGQPPFPRPSITEVARAHVLEPLPAFLGSGVPADLEAWLRRLLAKNPDERPQFAADVAEALAGLKGPMRVGQAAAAAPLQTNETWFTLAGASSLVEEGSAEDAEMGSMAPATPPADWRQSLATRFVPRHSAELALAVLRNPPLFGREQERDLLWGALASVRAEGRAAICLVTGPPGSGRTALLGWFAERVVETGAGRVVRRGAGWDDPMPDPTASVERPVVLIVDDAAEDEAAVAFAAHHGAARALEQWPCLLVLAGTADDLRHVQIPGRQVAALEPLADADIEALVGHLLRLEDRSLQRIVEVAAGSPAVAVGAVTTLARSGGWVAGPDGYHLPADDVVLQTGLEEVLDGSLRAAAGELTQPDLHLLAFAACIGQMRSRGEWARYADGLGLVLPEGLVPSLLLHGVISGSVERWCVSGGMRDRIRGLVGPEAWRAGCVAAASAMRDEPRQRARCGLLWLESGEVESALALLTPSMRVGDDSNLRLWTRWLTAAIDAYEVHGIRRDRRLAEALRNLAEVQNNRGQLADAMATGKALLDLARSEGWREHEVHAMREIASVAALRGESALDWFRQAWRLGSDLDRHEMGNVRLGLIRSMIAERLLDEAAPLVDEWIATARPGSHPHTAALRQRGALEICRRDFPAAIASIRRSIALDLEADRHHSAAFGDNLLAIVYLEVGDSAGAERSGQASLRVFREHGNLFGAAASLLALADVAICDGDLDAAEQFAGAAAEVHLALDAGLVVADLTLVELDLRRGRVPSAARVERLMGGGRKVRQDLVQRTAAVFAWLAVPDEGAWRPQHEVLAVALSEQTWLGVPTLACMERTAAAWDRHGRADLAAEIRAVTGRR